MKKRHGCTTWILLGALGLLVVVIVYIASIGSSSSPTSRPRATATSTTVRVRYVVTGVTTKARITYDKGDGTSGQEEVDQSARTKTLDAQPWQMTFTSARGAFLFLYAQQLMTSYE